MNRLLTLVALCAFSVFSSFAQITEPNGPPSAPAFQTWYGANSPASGYCAGPQNVGSQWNETGGTPQLFVCQQTGTNSQDQGAFKWNPVQFQPSGGGTTGTISVANGKAAVISNSLTFAGTDSTTMTFPGTSDTVVGLAATQTLTNKTLTSPTITGATLTTSTLTTPTITNPVITGPAAVGCGASCSPTAGQLILLNQASGSTATIPTSSGSGNVIRFRITVATTSAQEKILLTTTTDTIIGTAIGENGGTAKVFVGNAGTYHSIQMPYSGSQPSGGFIGDQITCTDIATGTWACDINYQGGTTPTTPYSTSTT